MPEFEWDELKRIANLAKHKLDFFDANPLFDGRNVLSTPSKGYNEERFTTTGNINGRFYTAVWTLRGSRSVLSPSGEQEMRKNGHIVTATAEEMSKLPSLSDWEAAARLTEEEIEAAIASDPDERDMVIDWSKAQRGIPLSPSANQEEPRRAILRTALTFLAFVPALLNRLFRPSGKR
jgi:uncharacterized DUF497 family protein